jgi:hypothetical protein
LKKLAFPETSLSAVFFSRPAAKVGMTLIEIVMGASILAMLFFFSYRLFSSFTRTQEVGHWAATTTKQLRNGLTLLRNEMSRATKPEVVTQRGSVPFDTGNGDRELFMYVPATIPFETENVSVDQKLLHFYMCRPGKQSLPGETDIAPEILSGTLYLEGGKLKYRRQIVTQPADYPEKIGAQSQIIAEHISKISITVSEVADPDDLSVKNRNLLTIALTSRHPRYTASTVTESLEGTFEVLVRRGGHP